MPSKEMYDYLSVATVNFTSSALNVKPQDTIEETGVKNQLIRFGDDGSEERISFSNTPVFYVTMRWNNERSSDIGTVMDYFYSTARGNGVSRSFKWDHPIDGHRYVVRFDGDITRTIRPAPYAFGVHALPSIRLRILGTT